MITETIHYWPTCWCYWGLIVLRSSQSTAGDLLPRHSFPSNSNYSVCVRMCVWVNICVWVFVCVCAVFGRLILDWLGDGGREVKEGICVSTTTHLIVALYKARRGGRERRANRYWQGMSGIGRGPCCLLQAHPMRGFKTQPTCRQRPRLRNITLSIAFLLSCAFQTGPADRSKRRQVAMPINDTQPPQPAQSNVGRTHPQT